jgi:hypothetical protein
MGMGGERHAPAALPPGITRYPLYRRLGRPQGQSGRVLTLSPPPVFDPVASRYTDYAIPTHPFFLWASCNSFEILTRTFQPFPVSALKSLRLLKVIVHWFLLLLGRA